MSYIVSIERPGSRPIEPAEVERLLANDPKLSRVDDEPSVSGAWLIHWRPVPGTQPIGFVFAGGVISSTTTPSNATVRKMQDMARVLGARVIGEEGEDLTDVDLPEDDDASAGACGCALPVVLLLVGVVWWSLA